MKVEIEKLDHFGRGITHVVGKICVIENAILDKQVYVSDGQSVKGTKEDIILLEKRNIV